MSIRKRGDRYQVRIRLGNGERIEKTLPVGATRADAQTLSTQIRRRQIEVASGRPPTRLIDEVIDQWVATSAPLLKSYQPDLRYKIEVVREYTAGKTLDELPAVAETIKANCLRDGLTAATANRYQALLKRVANLALRWGWTDKSLGKQIEMLPGEVQRHVYLSVDEVRELAAAAEPLTRDMIMFAALTGLRRSEILRLVPGDIVDGAILLNANTKSGRARSVPLPRQALAIALRRIPFAIEPRVLINRFERARQAAGMDHVRFHDLRHSYASWLVRGGATLVDVRDLLGHSSLSVTSRYAHTRRPDLVRATRRLKI